MGRIEKTLAKVSRLSNPSGALWKCYRDDKFDLTVCWMGSFPADVQPDRIRVTVEWDEAVVKT
jgi:hypothetical protein